MRLPISVFLPMLAAVVLTPVPAAAKEKKMPAPEWGVEAAKTPTPKDVGSAPAVVLFDEYTITVDEKNRAVERERLAVRILQPQGRHYGNCAISYNGDSKVSLFRSWTITAEGKQFQAMDEDFNESGGGNDPEMQFDERTRRVKPPAADPGAVVICETEQPLAPYMNFENWEIQSSIPIVHEALDLILPPGGHAASSWRRYAAVKPVEVAPNHLRWSIEQMPRIDLENLHATPAWSALAARMCVFWGDVAVKGAEEQWRMLGQWGGKLQEHRTDPSPEIRAKVEELVAGAPDLYTKLSRITEYIQKNVRYFIVIRGIGGWQAHFASDIYRHHYGDCKDKTTLLIAMLKAIDVKSYHFVVDSRRGVIDPDAPSLTGNHMVTLIELPAGTEDKRLAARIRTADGKDLLVFDPTDEETPLGMIRGELQGGWGYLFAGERSRVLRMPVLAPETAGLERVGNLTLAADGSLSGDITESFRGDAAMWQRENLKATSPKEIQHGLEERLGAKLPGVVFKSFEYHQTKELSQPVGLDLHLSVPAYAHVSGPLLLVRPRLIGSDALHVPEVMEGKPRMYPIVLSYPGRWHNRYEIALPPGYVVDEMPDPVDVDMGFARYRSKVSVEGGKVRYESLYEVRQVEIPAVKAADFRRLEENILSSEAGTVVLKKQ